MEKVTVMTCQLDADTCMAMAFKSTLLPACAVKVPRASSLFQCAGLCMLQAAHSLMLAIVSGAGKEQHPLHCWPIE